MVTIIITRCATRTLLKLLIRTDDELEQKRSIEAHTNIAIKNSNDEKTKKLSIRQPMGKESSDIPKRLVRNICTGVKIM
jgi:hypothetical protein